MPPDERRPAHRGGSQLIFVTCVDGKVITYKMSTAGQTITCKAAVAYAPGEPLSVEDIQVRVGISSTLIPKVYDVRGVKDAAAKAMTLLEQLPL